MNDLYIVNNERKSALWLEQNGLTATTPGVYPLANNKPSYDSRIEAIYDGGTGGNPQEGYFIDWIVEKLGAEELAANLVKVKADKTLEILDAANAMSSAIKAKYSTAEIDSWWQQESEARAILLKDDAPAPLLRALAANAEVTVLEFAKRVVANADAAAAATEAIILQQQTMELAVKKAENIEAVLAISVNYCLE